MSINSYSNYEASFPKGTKLSNKSYLYDKLDDYGDRYHIFFEDNGARSESFLDELITLFGKPLDRIPGLKLEAFYSLDEDEHWEFRLEIDDGKVECSQTVTTWKDCAVEDAGVDIGRPNVSVAKHVWDELEDVCVDDDGNIDSDFIINCYPFYRRYPKGTLRESIWHDIEDELHVSVAYLMGEAKNPDGTDD